MWLEIKRPKNKQKISDLIEERHNSIEKLNYYALTTKQKINLYNYLLSDTFLISVVSKKHIIIFDKLTGHLYSEDTTINLKHLFDSLIEAS